MQRRAGAVAVVGIERVAGDAGAERLGVRVAGELGQRIGRAGRRRAEMPAGLDVPFAHHAIRAADQQRPAVGLRRRATRPARRPRPDRAPARGSPRRAPRCRPRGRRRRDTSRPARRRARSPGVGATCASDRIAPLRSSTRSLPSAPPTPSRSPGSATSVLSGVGKGDRHRRRLGLPRPEDQIGVIAGADQRAVGEEGDRVDVAAMAFEHARLPARERPEPDAGVPRGGGEHRRRPATRRAPRPARHGLREPGPARPGPASRSRSGHPRRRWRSARPGGPPRRSPGPHGTAAPRGPSPVRSDQTIALVSKLPVITAPSGVTAIARTGPPWPRSSAAGRRRADEEESGSHER